MNTDSLEHTLAEEERIRFERDGYFVLEKVMSPAQVAGLTGAFDRMVAEACSGGQDAEERFTIRDVLWRDPLFLDLVDWPTTLPKVWGILGWNIQVYHTVLMYSPPGPGRTEVDFLGWHQDSGQLNRDLEVSPRPRISIKVAFFLSDCSEPGRANFWAIPGSHLQDELERPADGSVPAGQCRFWCRQGEPSCSTAGSGMPPAPTFPRLRARSSSMDTATAGCGRGTTRASRGCSTGASRSGGSCWVVRKTGGTGTRRRRKRTYP